MPQVRSVRSRADTHASTFCFALLIATVWLATRPYMGVIHDLRFYTVQALSALLPGRFADDLYFRYGSADQFTLFTLAYQPVLAALGIAKAAMTLTIVGQSLWIGGLLYLARGIFRDSRTALVAVMMAVALPGGIMFSYGEQFLTPRLFAEAITLWALGAMLRRRSILAVLLLGFSATIHPIMTAPGFAVLFIHEAAGRRVWWALGALAVTALLGLAFWGVQPFARLLETFDPAWFDVVRVRDFFCLLTKWTLFDWLKACNIFILAGVALSVAEPHQRRFLVATLAVAVGGLVVTLLGDDLLHNVLIVDAQQYRATWLLAVVANLSVGALLLRRGITSSLTGATLVLAAAMLIVATFMWVATFNWAVYIIVTPILAFAGLAFVWDQNRQRPIPACIRMLILTVVGVACGLVLLVLYLCIASIEVWPSWFWQTTRGLGLTVAALVAVTLHVSSSADKRRAVTDRLVLFATGLVAIAALCWDQRTPWTKFVETVDVVPSSLSSLLPEHRSIYWEGDVRVPWFVLKRPSYFSCAQGTGALFFRGTAITYQHRYDILERLRTLDFGQETTCPSGRDPESAPLNREEFASICANEPELGALVLTRPMPDVPGRAWVSPVKFEDISPAGGKLRTFSTDIFFVYPCTAVQ